jgi:hypothetical protein
MAPRFSIVLVLPYLLLAGIALPITLTAQKLLPHESKFIENRGQWDHRARFLLRSRGLDLWITDSGVVYDLYRNEHIALGGSGGTLSSSTAATHSAEEYRNQCTAVILNFTGADPAASARGSERAEGYHNYFIGNDRSRWATNVPIYGGARIEHLYHGIDAVFYLDNGMPRYDLTVAPGADVSQICMQIEGATELHARSDGTLAIETPLGTLEQGGLYAYQLTVDGRRQPVDCQFAVDRKDQVRFVVGSYDRARPLVVDPIVYSTFFGGNGPEEAGGITLDSSRNAYLCGITQSGDFPTKAGLQPNTGGGEADAYIVKLTSSGAIDYATYLGGNGADVASQVAVVGRNVIVAGETSSNNFPTIHAAQPTFASGIYDAFVTRLNDSGQLVYSTYLGGSKDDYSSGIAIDDSGNAYVAGTTDSDDFPTSQGSGSTHSGGKDLFVAELTANGQLVYSIYLGGSWDEEDHGIAIDRFGNAYVTGATHSENFPVLNAIQPTATGSWDAFVTKVAPGGALAYSTYIGGHGDDFGAAIAVDTEGNTYITGNTLSVDYPTRNPFQSSTGGKSDAFVTKLTPDGALDFSTYLGGAKSDTGDCIALGPHGNVFVSGHTASRDFPNVKAEQPAFAGGNSDLLLVEITASGMLAYSSYLGGQRTTTNDHKWLYGHICAESFSRCRRRSDEQRPST